MAKVIVCDKCGKVIHLNEDYYGVKSYSLGPATKKGILVELCTDCYNKFENYFKHIKPSK